MLEPWITPSIFQNLDQSLGIVDEFTLTQKLGSDAAYGILKAHVCSQDDVQGGESMLTSCSGIAGVPLRTFRRSPMLASIPSGYQLGTGRTPSRPGRVSPQEQRHILMQPLTGREERA